MKRVHNTRQNKERDRKRERETNKKPATWIYIISLQLLPFTMRTQNNTNLFTIRWSVCGSCDIAYSKHHIIWNCNEIVSFFIVGAFGICCFIQSLPASSMCCWFHLFFFHSNISFSRSHHHRHRRCRCCCFYCCKYWVHIWIHVFIWLMFWNWLSNEEHMLHIFAIVDNF